MSMALNPCQAPVSRLLLRPRVYYTAGPDPTGSVLSWLRSSTSLSTR